MKNRKAQTSIVWFKRDLRVHDHKALFEAASLGHVVPVYIVEDEYWGLPDTSGRQWMFIRECLEDLILALENLGAPLLVKRGHAPTILKDIISKTDAAHVYSHEETGNAWTYARDIEVGETLEDLGCSWTEYPQFGVQRGATNRDKWSKTWDAFMSLPQTPTPKTLRAAVEMNSEPLPTPNELGLLDDCPGRQEGGRKAGLVTLGSFLHERGETYRTGMSSPVSAQTECSRLSTFLSTGTVSMRESAQALWTRQKELKDLHKAGQDTGTWRSSMSSFNGRLHWHCHFTQKLEDAPRQEVENMHPFYDGLRDDPTQDAAAAKRLKAWSEGQTGFPFVDACMRSLNATGWINFRMRAMLMAVSSYHLWLHWRQPGLLYAQKFTDYEPGIHWPQVQMQSGTTGINTVRIYNPVKQGHDQDPTGVFTRRWVPELSGVPDKYLQEPWEWSGASGMIPKAYPERIVDHMQAARDAKTKIYALRRKKGHREIAKQIAEKHGSRRPTDRQRQAWKKSKAKPVKAPVKS